MHQVSCQKFQRHYTNFIITLLTILFSFFLYPLEINMISSSNILNYIRHLNITKYLSSNELHFEQGNFSLSIMAFDADYTGTKMPMIWHETTAKKGFKN